MAGSVNKVILVGNVGQNPQIRTMSNGQKVATLSLATSDRWKDKQTGETKKATEWYRIVVFNASLIDVVERMVQKGTRLYVEGQLRTRKWQTQTGQDAYTTEIILNGFNATLIIAANGRPSGQTPPPIDTMPDGPGNNFDKEFDKAMDIMDNSDIPF